MTRAQSPSSSRDDDRAMARTPPPSHLSSEAQAYLRDPDPPAPVIDYTDPEVAQAQRLIEHPEWEKGSEDLSGAWAAEPNTIAGVPVVRFSGSAAATATERTIVYVHGGGYVLGNPMACATMAVPVAQRTGLTVVSVGYRLAPEHRCLAAIEDVVTVHRRLSTDHEIVGMCGDSAGGGRTLSAAAALRDGGDRLLGRLGLIAPWVDLTCSSDTHATLRHVDPYLPHAGLPQWFARAYVGDDVADPAATPLFADLRDLPPVLIQVGGRDVLLGDSLRLATAIGRAGGRAALDVWDGMWHVWHIRSDLPETVTAFDELAALLMSSDEEAGVDSWRPGA